MQRTRQPYSLEFRQQILDLLRTGRTPIKLAREFEPSGETIRQWVKQAELDAGQRQDGLTTNEKAVIAKLRREVKRLKQEQEILKKSPPGSLRKRTSFRRDLQVHKSEPG